MHLESPALCNATELPAYEVKFLLSEREARLMQDRLAERMTLDAHADPSLDNMYRITSVYFDTPRFDVLAKSPKYKRRKYRVRRYGEEPTTFLERKTKREQQVRKRRTLITLDELHRVLTPPEEWEGIWFAQQLLKRELRPVCVVSYQRMAFVGPSATGPIRVTFDRHARGQTTDELAPHVVTAGEALLHDEVITEFKFLGTMPSFFKEIVETLHLSPQAVSKYRRCAAAMGFVPAGSAKDV